MLLWRALRDIGQGFYIDVGAWHPDIDSVTRAFYDRGWRGINIEPVEDFYRRLVAARRRDVNLRLAAGAAEGEAELIVVEGTGLSTLHPTCSLVRARCRARRADKSFRCRRWRRSAGADPAMGTDPSRCRSSRHFHPADRRALPREGGGREIECRGCLACSQDDP